MENNLSPQTIFEEAGRKVKKINNYNTLEFSCEEDDEEFLTKI